MEQIDKRNLLILLFVSLVLSAFLFSRTYVISMDGAFQYIPMARLFVSGSFPEAISYGGQQPLYPLMIAWISPWVPDLELAGRLISSLFGILLAFPAYFLAKRVADERVALVSTLFLIIHPYLRRFSADLLKESTYLFFFALALWFSLRAFERERITSFVFIPFLAAAAYFVRADGIEIILSVFIYILISKQAVQPGKKIKVIGVLLLSSGFLLLLSSLLHLKEPTGVWALSKTKTLTGLLGWGQIKDGISWIDKILFSLRELNSEIIATVHPVYVFFLVIGFAKKIRSGLKTGDGFLMVLWVLHYGVLFLLILNLTGWSADGTGRHLFFSARHVLPLLMVSLPWIGEGFLTVYEWISRKTEPIPLFLWLKPHTKRTLLWVELLILILVILLPKTLEPQRYERLPEKWAGIWIKSQSGKGSTIFTTMPRVAYYADGVCERIHFGKASGGQIHAAMAKKKAFFLVIREEESHVLSEVAEPIRTSFLEAMRYDKKGMERIIVYRRGP